MIKGLLNQLSITSMNAINYTLKIFYLKFIPKEESKTEYYIILYDSREVEKKTRLKYHIIIYYFM